MGALQRRASGLERGELTIGRFVIPYATAGNGARSLVCINAVQQTMAAWRTVLSRFADEPRYRLILFDFPHQGRARIEHGPGEVPLMEQVDILAGVTHALSPKTPVAAMGASWGAVIAAAWAATCPDQARAVLLGSFQTRPNPRLRAIARRVHELVAAGDTEALGTLFIDGFGAGLRPAAQSALCDQFRRLTAEQLRQMASQSEDLATYGHLGALADLGAIRARTLIVNGAGDPIVDADNTWEAGRLIADSEVHLLPGVGHFLHMEDPAVMELYVEFLDRTWRAVAESESAAPLLECAV